jgi:hypothetical protein
MINDIMTCPVISEYYGYETFNDVIGQYIRMIFPIVGYRPVGLESSAPNVLANTGQICGIRTNLSIAGYSTWTWITAAISLIPLWNFNAWSPNVRPIAFYFGVYLIFLEGG